MLKERLAVLEEKFSLMDSTRSNSPELLGSATPTSTAI